jgi:prefoldin subunit 5
MEPNIAIRILDGTYETNEYQIKERIRRCRELADEMDKLAKEMAELNKQQIIINNARKTLRKAADKDK